MFYKFMDMSSYRKSIFTPKTAVEEKHFVKEKVSFLNIDQTYFPFASLQYFQIFFLSR